MAQLYGASRSPGNPRGPPIGKYEDGSAPRISRTRSRAKNLDEYAPRVPREQSMRRHQDSSAPRRTRSRPRAPDESVPARSNQSREPVAGERYADDNYVQEKRSSRHLDEAERERRRARRAEKETRSRETQYGTALEVPQEERPGSTMLNRRTSKLMADSNAPVIDATGDIERHAKEEPRSSRRRQLASVPQGQVGEMPQGRVFSFTGIDNLAELMETDSFHMACFSIYLFRSTLDYETVKDFFEVLLQLYPKYRYVADLQPYSAGRRDRKKREQLKALARAPPGAREAYERAQESARAEGRLPFNPGPRTWYSRTLKSGSLLRPAQWRIDDDFHVSENIEVVSLGGDGTGEEMHSLAGRFLARHFDYNKPLWEALLVQGLNTEEGARSALMIKIHHSFSDGQGMIQSYHAALTAMSKDMGIKDVQQYADRMRERKASKPKTKRTFGATMAHGSYVARELYYRRRRTFVYRNPKISRAVGRLYSHSEGVRMDDFKLIRKAFARDGMNLTLNDVATALLARAMARVADNFSTPGKKADKRAAIFVPISLRPEGDWSLNNYTTGSLSWLPFPENDDDVEEHLLKVHREMYRMKHSHLPVIWYKLFDFICKRRIMYLPNYPVYHSMYNRTVSEYHVATNVPGPIEPVKFGKHEAFSYHVLPPSSPGKSTLAIGMISYAQDFSLAVACDDVQEFADLPTQLCNSFQESAQLMISAAQRKLELV